MAAVFVLPATTVGKQGPVAALLSTAGWASAARRVLGQSWIVTPSGVIEPEQARKVGTASHLKSASGPTWRSHVPAVAKTAIKDAREWRRARQFDVAADGPWADQDLNFVWQRHELFHTTGADLATSRDVPLVLFVPAPLVWEARQWGTTRPGWGWLVERIGERPSMAAADVVACGSDLVAEQVVRLGADPSRVIITPTGVDLDLFDAESDRSRTRQRLGIDDRFVVGWVGSFRTFHSLKSVVQSVSRVEGSTLLMVGDGPQRPSIEEYAASLDVHVVFTGTVAHRSLPDYLAAMDTAVVSVAAGESFHYSPLKLAEYLAAGLPVVVPTVVSPQNRLHHRVDALLVEPGDINGFTAALIELRDDEALRKSLGVAAKASAQRTWSWDHQVRKVLTALGQTPS